MKPTPSIAGWLHRASGRLLVASPYTERLTHALYGLLFLGTVLAPHEALAHAKLIRSQPRPFEVLDRAPVDVRLWFNERLEDEFNAIEVMDATGGHVEKRVAYVNSQDRTNLLVQLGNLSSGSYVIHWKILSLDGHPARGRLIFTVKSQSPDAAVISLLDLLMWEDAPSSPGKGWGMARRRQPLAAAAWPERRDRCHAAGELAGGDEALARCALAHLFRILLPV